MKYYFDCEFIEDGKTIDLISIGIISENGHKFYHQNSEFAPELASDWVWKNVYSKLEHFSQRRSVRSCNGGAGYGGDREDCGFGNCPWLKREAIANEIGHFCNPRVYGPPEFWGYYADYDWVALCQLFGTMMNLPEGWPKYCRDVKQLCDDLGNPKLPPQDPEGEHHALKDAIWTMDAHNFLVQLDQQQHQQIINHAPAAE